MTVHTSSEDKQYRAYAASQDHATTLHAIPRDTDENALQTFESI